MAIDKKNSPGWYKVVVWIILICFVAGFVVSGAMWIFNPDSRNAGMGTTANNNNSSQETTTQALIAVINAQYQPQVETKQTALKAAPESFDANKDLGVTYFQWGQDLMSMGDAQAWAHFQAAVPYLKKAYGLKPADADVANNYVRALAYSGDQAVALSTAREVTQKIPASADAWFNLGLLLAQSNEANAKKDAIAAFRTAIEKDTSGTVKASAQQQIDTLDSVK